MNDAQKLSVLRNLFTRLQAETISRYAKAGVLNEIEEERRILSISSGKISAQLLSINEPEEAFSSPASIIDCATWRITNNEKSLTAVCTGCKLAAMCKNLYTYSPCNMYCLNPIEGIIKALKTDVEFKVKSTLMSGDNCFVEVKWS